MRRRAVSQRFQSTLPARGATFLTALSVKPAFDFNPRSPHGERRAPKALPDAGAGISIHAPRTGSDRVMWRLSHCHSNFNPRSPHGERPATLAKRTATTPNFNPRSPHGERRFRKPLSQRSRIFQSTLPARGATPAIFAHNRILRISIHAPRTGSDPRTFQHTALPVYFNPRSPHGERLRKVTILSIRIIGFAQKVYHKTVLLRISLAENAVILPEKPRNPVRTSLQKAGGLRFARAIRAARPYSISSPSGA